MKSSKKAGFVHNTFPFMGPRGQLIPKDYFNRHIAPAYLNVFENQPAVQFNHRTLGAMTAAFSALLFLSSLGAPLPPLVRRAAFAVFLTSFLQVQFFHLGSFKGVLDALRRVIGLNLEKAIFCQNLYFLKFLMHFLDF